MNIRGWALGVMAGACLLACRRTSEPPSGAGDVAPGEDVGERALAEVARFLRLGPRVAGTPGAAAAADYLAQRLADLGVPVEVDKFRDMSPFGEMVFRNVVGRLAGTEPGVIVLAAHYDTKAGIADAFQGANDSGSGVGLLLELARRLQETPRNGPAVWFVFLDGEECRVRYGPHDGLHGSRRMAAQLAAGVEHHPVRAVVVVDMIGDRDLRVTIPRNVSPELLQMVLEAARAEGVRAAFGLHAGAILDDHQPFLDAGFPAVLLIDFEYGPVPGSNAYWHTMDDTLDKLSAESLETVGRVVLRFLHMLGGRGTTGPPTRNRSPFR